MNNNCLIALGGIYNEVSKLDFGIGRDNSACPEAPHLNLNLTQTLA